MPLIVTTLQSQLQIHFDNPPQTTAQAAQAWANAIQVYAATIIPPSSTSAAAVQALQGALQGMDASGAAVGIFTAAFAAFGVALAGGMPVGTGPAVPPPGPMILPVSLTDQSQVAALALATTIDIWMRTGLSAPPASLPWS